MLNPMKKDRRAKLLSLLAVGLLFVTALGLGAWGMVSVAAAAPIQPQAAAAAGIVPPADHEQDPAKEVFVAPPPEVSEQDKRVLLEEMALVHLQWEQYGYAKTACAGSGLNNIEPAADGPMVLIPNAGDLSVDGSNVSIKLTPEGEIAFIPRVQGQRIRVPMDLGDKVEGQEVLSLTFDEGMQLITAGKLIWTAKGQGPYGNGYGLPGHIAACDPLYSDEVFDAYQDEVQNNEL
ncbi:MAG: hypothetical protein AB1801_01035 [Chloroflexota bacterium]